MKALLIFIAAMAMVPVRAQQLNVHESGRFLVKENGEPFFWLGDTGWRIFGDMDREEIDRYFADRVSKGFNVIQCQILHFDLDGKNAYGHKAMEDRDINRLVEDYWQHADYILHKASEMGLYLAIVPALGKKLIEPKWKGDPADVIFATDTAGAYNYGKFLGSRYARMKNIIWVMGGDTWGYNDTIYYSIAKGIADGAADGDFDKVLITFHPQGGTYRPPATSSGEFYHHKEWLDFNMIQSGHREGNRNYKKIAEDYDRTPVKPTIDAEPCYEHHPMMHRFSVGDFDAWHMRRRAYWSVLAGGFGFSYGANGIWQVSLPSERSGPKHNYYWFEALDFEGAYDMGHVRDLFESRPFIDPERIPDQRILAAADTGLVDGRVQCARAADFSYWIVYITNGKKIILDLKKFTDVESVDAWWYNPRDGNTYDNENRPTTSPFITTRTNRFLDFDPPGKKERNNDWVLVLDDSRAGYDIPGRKPK